MEPSVSVSNPKKIGPYVFRGIVGEGAFSVVKLVWHETTRQFYAAKIVPKTRIDTADLRARFEIEIRTHRCLHHPSVVEFFDLLQDDLNYYAILEFCPNGELFQYIIDQGHLTEEAARPFIVQVLEALRYIHSRGISHRDLKPENVLLGEFGRVKLSDFGLSRFLGPENLVDTPCGSPCYASPECLSGRPYDGRATDVWSLGVIVFAMLTGQLPWTKRVQSQLFEQIRVGDYSIPVYLTPACRSFIKGLMTVKVEQRLTIEQALDHPWLAGTQRFGDTTSKSGFLSLRLIDNIFGQASEELEASEARLKREESWTPNSFDAVGKLITEKGLFREDPAALFRKISCPEPTLIVLRASRTGTSHVSGQNLPRLTRHDATRPKGPPGKKSLVVKPVPHDLKPRKV